MTDASGVDETEGDTAQLDAVFNGIASGALNVADDGTLFTNESVEQRALTYVGRSNDGNRYAVFQGVTGMKRVSQSGYVRYYLL